MFTLTLETLNEAFDGANHPIELARILRVVANRIEAGQTEGNVRDINGNRVGSFHSTVDAPAEE